MPGGVAGEEEEEAEDDQQQQQPADEQEAQFVTDEVFVASLSLFEAWLFRRELPDGILRTAPAPNLETPVAHSGRVGA